MSPEEKKCAVEFGERLKYLREEAGLSQEDLADNSDLHVTFISRLENGHRVPSLYTLQKLAVGLGLSPSKLLGYLAT